MGHCTYEGLAVKLAGQTNARRRHWEDEEIDKEQEQEPKAA